MMKRHPAIALAALMLSACVAAAPPSGVPDPGDSCGAVARIGLVGQPVSAATDLPQGARVIRPGDAVTEDFSASRLNLYLDGGDIITSLTCG